MDDMETISGGVIGAIAASIMLFFRSLFERARGESTKSDAIASLATAINNMVDSNTKAIAAFAAQVLALRTEESERERGIVAILNRLADNTESVASVVSDSVTNVAQLTAQIGTLETAMTEHTNAAPTIADLMAEVKLLRDEVRDAMETFNKHIKKTTQETPAVKTGKTSIRPIPVVEDSEEGDLPEGKEQS